MFALIEVAQVQTLQMKLIVMMTDENLALLFLCCSLLICKMGNNHNSLLLGGVASH